jgi:hypothetical protein
VCGGTILREVLNGRIFEIYFDGRRRTAGTEKVTGSNGERQIVNEENKKDL